MGHGRTGAIERAAGSASARSFLLTPELVAALNDHGKVDIPDLNYHIAHVALLQAAAESYGLLNGGGMTDAVPDGGNSDEPGRTKVEFAPLQLDRFGDWCRSLGLDAETVSYASGVAARLEDPEAESGAAARLIEAGERLDSEGTGLDLDDDKVDAAMREQVEKLKESRTDGLGGGEVQRTLQEALHARAATLHGLRGRRGRFITNAETLKKFARVTGESLEVHAGNAERRAARENAGAEKALQFAVALSRARKHAEVLARTSACFVEAG